MRRAAPLLGLLILLAAAPTSLAQQGPLATLSIEVQDDHEETMTLTLDDLRRLTRYDGICLPAGATETRVYDELGDATYEAKDENGRRSIGFVARGETIHIEMARPSPGNGDHPLYASDVNFCVPAQARVVVELAVPEGHEIFFMSGGATIDGRTARMQSDGPTHVFYSYEAPIGGTRPITLIEAGPFRVFVPTPHAPQAQEVANLAVGPYRAALAEAGLDVPFDAIRVLYQEETPFPWEAGHYNGAGFVAVKEETLNGDAEQGYPISAVRVLVHEGFHAAHFPYGKGVVADDVAWFLEGSARRSERHVDAALPNATRHCEKTAAEVKCWDFDDRIKRADLETGYGNAFTFDAGWEPSAPQSDDTRRFYYSYSEFVVGAWIERHGEDEYRRVWDEVEAAFLTGAGCPCPDGWLVAKLDDPQLFRPWSDVKGATPAEFDALVKPFTKDEEALARELKEQANPFSGVPLGALVALAALGLAALAWTRRR